MSTQPTSVLRFPALIRGAALAAVVSLAGTFIAAASPETQLVSVNWDGTGTGNHGSSGSAFSVDGRFVVFVSSASDLLGTSTPGQNVYVRDLVNGTTTLVSVDQSGTGGANYQCFNPAISADGRYVVFESTASNLVPNDTNGVYGRNGHLSDVFVRDLQAGVTTLVSVNKDNTDSGEDESFLPSMTPDGTAVAFYSRAKNLVSEPATGCPYHPSYELNVYVRHMPYGPTELVSNDTNGRIGDVFVRDMSTQETRLVSVTGSGGSGNGLSFPQAITPDGRFVAFYSLATNMAGVSDSNGTQDSFVRDLQNDTTTLVSVSQAGTGTGNGQSLFGGLSADGRIAAFVSSASDLVPNDTNGTSDVFFRDLQNRTTALASTNATATASGNNYSSAPFVSPDGRLVVFTSTATDLVDLPDRNGQEGDVFIRRVVPTPQEALADLIALPKSFGLPKGPENSLSSKLENAQKSLEDGNTAAACGQLEAFINEVIAQSGKKLSVAQADQLSAAAAAIRAALGCS